MNTIVSPSNTKSIPQNEYLVYFTLNILRRLRVSAATWEEMEPVIWDRGDASHGNLGEKPCYEPKT